MANLALFSVSRGAAIVLLIEFCELYTVRLLYTHRYTRRSPGIQSALVAAGLLPAVITTPGVIGSSNLSLKELRTSAQQAHLDHHKPKYPVYTNVAVLTCSYVAMAFATIYVP